MASCCLRTGNGRRGLHTGWVERSVTDGAPFMPARADAAELLDVQPGGSTYAKRLARTDLPWPLSDAITIMNATSA